MPCCKGGRHTLSKNDLTRIKKDLVWKIKANSKSFQNSYLDTFLKNKLSDVINLLAGSETLGADRIV
jgi:hypothetical protein